MSNRILDYPEATEITSNDYILLDNEGTGAKCIKASALNINMDNYTIKEARGAIASFDDGEDLPLAFMGAYINAIQEGSGDPSPTNVRPISGWTEAEVSVSGINVWDEEWELGSYDNTTGAKVTATNRIRSKNYIECKPNTTYYAKLWEGATFSFRLFYYDVNKSFISSPEFIQQGTFTTPANACYMTFILATTYGTTYNNDVSINYPSTDTEYHAYNGNTYSLTFTDGSNPLIVYYGTVDLISGLLTINKCGDDMGNMNYTYQSLSGGRNGFSVSISDMKETTGGSEIIDAISSCYKATNYNGTWANGNMSYFYPTGKTVIFINNDYTDASTFKTAMTGQQFVYPLATPLTYQLSKQQIKSLVGENNIFADTGDSVVDYRKLWVMPEM